MGDLTAPVPDGHEKNLLEGRFSHHLERSNTLANGEIIPRSVKEKQTFAETAVSYVQRALQNKAYGNRCRHDPHNFRDICFPNEKNRPKITQWAMTRIRKFVHLDDKLSELKQLNSRKKDGHLRKIRSEGRESLMGMSLILFFNLELSTMTVRMDDIHFRSPTLEQLTKKGQHLSLSRAYRALRKLKQAGLISVTSQFEKSKDDIYCAFASIKEVTYQFFKMLGLGKYYSFSKSYKQKILEKRATKRQRRKGRLELFDKFLPDRRYEKISAKEKAYKFVSEQDIQKMRQALIEFLIRRSPSHNVEQLTAVVHKFSYDALKSHVESMKKVHPPQAP